MPDIVLRPATPEDMPAVTAIYAHHVENGLGTFEEIPPDVAEMTRRRDDMLGRGLPYFVACDAGGVVGYAYGGPFRLRSAYRFAVEDSIYVAADQRGRGIGRLLLGELIDRCTAAGLRQMVAVIGDSGNAASIGLHRSFGFRPIGTFQSIGFKFGRWVDAVLMQRALGEGDTTLPG